VAMEDIGIPSEEATVASQGIVSVQAVSRCVYESGSMHRQVLGLLMLLE